MSRRQRIAEWSDGRAEVMLVERTKQLWEAGFAWSREIIQSSVWPVWWVGSDMCCVMLWLDRELQMCLVSYESGLS